MPATAAVTQGGAGAAQGPAPGGGALAAPAAVVASVACREGCAGAYARAGSLVALEGSGMREVRAVTFLGSRVPGDEVSTRPRRTSEHRVLVAVPAAAARGRVTLTDAEGATSEPSPIVRIAPRAVPKAGGGPIATVVTGRRAFIDGQRLPTLTYALTMSHPAAVVVQVVRVVDGAVVTSFDQGVVPPGESRSVSWDGTVAGLEQPEGHYAFVVVAADPGGAQATSSQVSADSPDAFVLLANRFPIAGKHDFGGAGAAFGGARRHQGHDIFARCGTDLVAARGGVVKMKRFQARAGNYIVIDGQGTDVDHAYMHLREPALVDQGDRVHTGQLIGHVGATGDASACHLHFEAWSGPGWYTGGSPFDPLPDLLAWDETS